VYSWAHAPEIQFIKGNAMLQLYHLGLQLLVDNCMMNDWIVRQYSDMRSRLQTAYLANLTPQSCNANFLTPCQEKSQNF